MDYETTNIIPSKSNSSIITSKSTNLCPFCHNFERTAKIDKKNFCKRHSSPFTCLIPKCYSVFPSKDFLIPHYRSHLNLASNSFLCNICLGVLDCSRNESKKKHTHQNLPKLITCCSIRFPTMTDFVCHKLQEHNGQIISKKYINSNGSTINPLKQNQKRSRRKKRLGAVKSAKRVEVNKIVDMPQILETPNSSCTGIFVCKLCPSLFSSLSDFVEHSESSHNITYKLKENEIKLCPLCDENYDISNFIEHISKCTDTMKVGDDSLNQYGCIHCQQIFSGMTASQFRNHFNYCRSFEVDDTDDNREKSRKCKNCIFESTNLENCLQHANSYCIYYKLKMKYAKECCEKDKVLERMKSQKQTAADILLVFIKPEITSDNVKINQSYCDWSRQKFLETYNYFCNNCKKGFYSCNVFLNHLTSRGVKCRSDTQIYCIRCVNDFDNVDSFNEHLPNMPPPPCIPLTPGTSVITTLNGHKPFIENNLSKTIKVEPCNYELNETTHYFNEEVNIVVDPVIINNATINLQLDDNDEIKNLELNDGILFQESEDSKSDLNGTLVKESKDSVFNDQLFQDIEFSNDDLKSVVKIDEEKPDINLLTTLDSTN